MLKRFYTAIVHRRRAVLAAFVLAAVLSVFASRAVQVDYDINGLGTMDEVFDRICQVIDSIRK